VADNDNLELKKRSRRRLVGAAALALLAAIVLPMVMDQEPGSPVQDIQVTIPDRDADNMLARPIAGRPPQAVEPQLAPPPEEQAPVSGAATDPPAGADDAPPVAEPPVVAPRNPSPPAATTSGSAAQKPTPQAAATPAPEEAARVRALLEGKAGAVASRDESYVVQVGAFGEAGKAASLKSDLKGRGFTAYTEKTGTVTRVRVGPFASRDQAEKVVEGLRAKGFNGVVAPR
jgi:DedD protein